MKISRRYIATTAIAIMAGCGVLAAPAAHARSAAQIAASGEAALQQLAISEPRSRLFAHHALGVLVFPTVFKAGLVVGAESGNGVLLIDGRPNRYYNLSGGTFGLQAGGQKFSYVVFFMNNSALRYLRNSDGFALGRGFSIALIDKGKGGEGNTTTFAKDAYAFAFNEKGLMADLTLDGTKISPIHPH